MRRFRPAKIDEKGRDRWSEWIQPRMRLYRMACCDCDLVHDMQFRVAFDRRGKPHVQFRARRAPRLTAQLRRRRKRR